MTYPASIHEGPRSRERWGEPCALCGFGEHRAVHLLPAGATAASAPGWWHRFAPRAQAPSAAEADLDWLLRYLQAHYSLGLPDVGARLASLDRGERLEFEVDPGEHQLAVIPTDYFGGHKPTVVDAIWRPGQRVLYRAGMSGNMVPSLIRDVSASN